MLVAEMKGSTLDGLNRTIWAVPGPMFMTWGLLGVPLGALLAGIGVLLYSNARSFVVWRAGLGMFVAVILAIIGTHLGHIPPLFGLGGS